MLAEAMKKAEELYMKHIYATEGQMENSQNSPMTAEVTISEVNAPQKLGQYSQRPWRNKESSEISPKVDSSQSRTRNEDNRQLPRGSYTHILVNPTQLSDIEFTAWMEQHACSNYSGR